jgi:hypothetical protein
MICFRRQSPAPCPTAAILLTAGSLIVLVPLDVRGFCLAMARDWHAVPPAWELACQFLLTITLQVSGHCPLSVTVTHIPRIALLTCTQRACALLDANYRHAAARMLGSCSLPIMTAQYLYESATASRDFDKTLTTLLNDRAAQGWELVSSQIDISSNNSISYAALIWRR